MSEKTPLNKGQEDVRTATPTDVIGTRVVQSYCTIAGVRTKQECEQMGGEWVVVA